MDDWFWAKTYAGKSRALSIHEGFISIDCGATESSTDERGIQWIPDNEYILTGETADVPEYINIDTPLRTLRFFGERDKNCYALQPVTQGSKYLIRGTFYYGNYDNLGVPPTFDLFVDANPWIEVNTYTDRSIVREIVTLAQTNSISVCLARINPNQNPFISSLELRLLSPSMYDIVANNYALISISRLNFGAEPTLEVRYPDDPFDRIWNADNVSYPAISTTRDTFTALHDQAPPAVMKTAKTTRNVSEPMTFVFNFPVVEALDDIKEHFQLQSWTGDPCLPSPYSWDWLNCSTEASVTRITTLKLSNSSLNGTIPESIAKLTALTTLLLANNDLQGEIPDLSALKELQILDLQDNKLNGSIPDSLSQHPNLTELNLANNNFSGQVPLVIATNKKMKLNISGNPNVCQPRNNSCVKAAINPGNRKSTDSSKGSSKKGLIIGLMVAGVTVVSITVIGIGRKPINPSPKPANYSDTARSFTYSEVRTATKDFETLIGERGFGKVFHGYLLDVREIAVKCLSAGSHQGENEFSAEVALLSRVHHKNLVSLVGYCTEGEHRILIYEYMHKGNLRDLLYGVNASSHRLKWTTRLDIALNAARGLEYLHTGNNPIIIHRDVKSDNILLNNRLLAKVSDFGLSKAGPVDGATHVSTLVNGTTGYLDPEYYVTNQLTEKSDVYSFGVLLLEIISGRQPINVNFPPEERNIVHWVRLMINSGNIEGLVDPIIRNKYNIAAMWKVVELAMACVENKGSNRPTMSEVVWSNSRSVTILKLSFQFSTPSHIFFVRAIHCII
eukprot:Gb_17959 [translate_table: standard]